MKKLTLTKLILMGVSRGAVKTKHTRRNKALVNNSKRQVSVVPQLDLVQLPDFPEALVKPVLSALKALNGERTMDHLLQDETGYFGRAWIRRNPSLHADYLPAAYEVPIATLKHMIESGELHTIEDLQIRIEQVLAMNGRKYGCLSYAKFSPKRGYGKRKRTEDATQLERNLFVSGLEQAIEKPDDSARPDEVAMASELSERLDQIRATMDPLDLEIFDAVQSLRAYVGVGGAYPRVAQRVILDAAGKLIGLRTPDAPSSLDAESTTSLVTPVRRIFLKVRHSLKTPVAKLGYPIPEPK